MPDILRYKIERTLFYVVIDQGVLHVPPVGN